ncbi:TIGR03564 family F420-dependent LLM class oxidoreductase [Streptomyces rochei]|uniref:TIGR03564 family F420-dependent LLM class oxidoreductase n=1 Tax=Streptomyces plicatus TaxID=1922 RepID=A0ABW1Y8Z9_STRPL|nr:MULTISPECIES: TIGR03564 family F420-dependent LLM class oxidoreductase [Streptomyces rochei group]WMI55434.1 TIGR03564 family F420-dependent LLM class oxidoreductase [Streptomyces rochei]GGZ57099.1 putative monooxygenase (luciferase-like) [Streptomyces plicatus]
MNTVGKKMGVFLGGTFAQDPGLTNLVDRAVELAHEVADAGIRTVWFGQAADYDAPQLAALVGRAEPRIGVGTSVVPTYPRHPLLLAAAAKTAQAATTGRFRLGVGLGARTVLEPQFGMPYPPQIKHLREYLIALRPLLDGDDAPFVGQTLTSRPAGPTTVAGAVPQVPVLVAAMGPRALAAAGELAEGTIPFLAGPRTLAEQIVPAITEAAAAAGRPAPQIVAGVPAVVTDDAAAARSRVSTALGFYDSIPSYRRVIASEGLSSAADLLIAGDEDTVTAGLRRYFNAGATEIMVTHADLFDARDRARTWAIARNL